MSHEVGYTSKFVVSGVPISLEVQHVNDDLVGKGKVFLSDVVLSPELHLIVRVHPLSLFEEVGLRDGHCSPQPDLMDYFGNDVRAFLLCNRNKLISIIEDQQL